jgi:hypothetical protein
MYLKVSYTTYKVGDIKPALEIKKLPDPPPPTISGILRWVGPSIILGTLCWWF